MTYNKVLLRFGEVGLKGRNRPFFINALIGNIKRRLAPVMGAVKVTSPYGRIFVHLPPDQDFPPLAEALARVFGLVSFSPVAEVPLEMEAIKAAALAELKSDMPQTFKVETRRALKSFPHTSPQVNAAVGGHLLAHCPGLKVDVHNPQRVVRIEIRREGAYVFSRVFPAAGGLPVGVAGKGMLLLSGGIDSPVAGWLAMKRGLELEAVYFDTPPFTSPRALHKVEKLAAILSRWGRTTLHVVNFTAVQKALMESCPEDLTITVMRRFMFRVAEGLAEARGALALLTGESLGQVASQTLESMDTINAVVSRPVLRPLIAMDKVEIIAMAEKISTYAVSVEPYQDCCALFVSDRPKTRPTRQQAEAAESLLDVDALVATALAEIKTTVFRNLPGRR